MKEIVGPSSFLGSEEEAEEFGFVVVVVPSDYFFVGDY